VRRWSWLLAILIAAGCGGGGGADPDGADAVEDPAPDAVDDAVDDVLEEEVWDPPPAAEDWSRDILSTGLVVDLATLEATATIVLAASDGTAASFEADGLSVTSVDAPGGPLDFSVVDGRLDVGVPSDGSDPVIVVDYSFTEQSNYDGLLPGGYTFIWPYFCGNLFPCHSDPTDGLTFTLDLENVPTEMTAVFPDSIPADAPSYQIGWSVAEYTEHVLGVTDAGTTLSVWYLPGGESEALAGTASLLAGFDWYEDTLGPYPFGDRAGSVAVEWGAGAYGGMEHHPYWHVSTLAMDDEYTHLHEAAHGWIGGGVRIACWEDFVLSEGTVTYLATRALGQAAGPARELALWSSHDSQLNTIVSGPGDHVAWPDSCGEVDILADLYTNVPYLKGAFFYRAVAAEIGADTLDGILRLFFETYGGQAAGMQDMLDMIQAESGFDPTDLASGWLRSLGRPDA